MHVKKKEAGWMGAACAAAHSWTDSSHAVPVPVPVTVSVYAENVKPRFCRQRQVTAGAASLLTQGEMDKQHF